MVSIQQQMDAMRRQLLNGHPDGQSSSLRDVISSVQHQINASPDILQRITEVSKRHFEQASSTDLDQDIRFNRQMINQYPQGDQTRAAFIGHLGTLYGERYTAKLKEAKLLYGEIRTAQRKEADLLAMKDLDKGIEILRRVVDSLLDKSQPDFTPMLGTLGNQLHQRWSAKHELSDLQESVKIARQIVNSSAENLDTNEARVNLWTRLWDEYQVMSQSNATVDLKELISIARQTVRGTPQDHPERAARSYNLARILHENYESTGEIDVEEAIRLGRESVDNTPQDHPDMAMRRHNLANSISLRHSLEGSTEDLEDAIQKQRQALQESCDSHTKVLCLNNLSTHLAYRYKRNPERADLREAIHSLQEARSQTKRPETSTVDERIQDAQSLGSLGLLLHWRYDMDGDESDLDDSISSTEQAIEALPQHHHHKAALLNNLAYAIFKRALKSSRYDPDPQESLKIARHAAECTPPGAKPNFEEAWNVWQHTLENSRSGVKRDVLKAANISRQAVKSAPADHPDKASALLISGLVAQRMYQETDDEEIMGLCLFSFSWSFKHRLAPIALRLGAAQCLLNPEIPYDPKRVYPISRDAVRLIPLLTSYSLQSSDKEFLLSDIAGIASGAAALALTVGEEPWEALELLETGRGVMAGALQDLRTDISKLEAKHPRLAEKFTNLRNELDASSAYGQEVLSSGLLDMVDTKTKADRRRAAERELLELLDEIRKQHGFKGFFKSPSQGEMMEAAAHGPIVVVNTSPHRCDALIILPAEIRHLALPRLKLENIRNRDPHNPRTLEWLWDVLVEPVLDSLGFVWMPVGNNWPHVWWIPTGPLIRFPLHAAGYHHLKTFKTTLDRVISSYSSSVKSTIHSRRRRRRASGQAGNVVLVPMATTPDYGGLRHTSDEITAVRKIAEGMKFSHIQPSPCRKDVLEALESCNIFHFAGHGGTHPTDPLRSALLLDDWRTHPLNVDMLLKTNISKRMPFLAYLSACGTGENHNDKLLDEGIHVASAFQLAGFQNVIGTLWTVDDELCVHMARLTYGVIREQGGLYDGAVSWGLHQATRHFRDQWVDGEEYSSTDADTISISTHGCDGISRNSSESTNSSGSSVTVAESARS